MPRVPNAPTIQNLIELSFQIHYRARNVYRELAKRFSHHEPSAALWKSLTEDEEAQAQVLTDVLVNATVEKLVSPVPADTWANAKRIWHLVHQDLLATVKNLKDAHGIAYQLEYLEVNAIFELLSVDVLPGHVEREFIRTHIAQHQQRLADFSENYVGPNWLEVIPHLG